MQAQPLTGSPQAARRPAGPGWRYRLGVTVRALAAIFGGYAVSALWAAALALLLPTVRVEAALSATMAALAIYPCAVMWCFGAGTARRALLGMLLAGAVPALLVMLLKGGA